MPLCSGKFYSSFKDVYSVIPLNQANQYSLVHTTRATFAACIDKPVLLVLIVPTYKIGCVLKCADILYCVDDTPIRPVPLA